MGLCSLAENAGLDSDSSDDASANSGDSGFDFKSNDYDEVTGREAKSVFRKPVDFTEVDVNLLPTVIIVGRPNVGKSALFNRLIRRREALVYNTPDDHVTRDIREGVAKLGDLRFKVLDSAGLETEASSGSILGRTSRMTANVLARSQFAVFLIDVRAGLHPLDLEVGKWLRRHASGIKPIVAMNKCESLYDGGNSLKAAADEAYRLGFGDPIAISAETGLGMTELYEVLKPVLEDYMLRVLNDEDSQENSKDCTEVEETEVPLQLAIVGRPNVGKSTLLNTLLQEDRVLVGPEAGLTRDSIRAHFEYQGRTIYLLQQVGWRTKQEKGPSSRLIHCDKTGKRTIKSKCSLMRAHVIALVLDAEEIANARRSMKHDEVVIARRAVEEGRGLVVIVNKMDLLKGKQNDNIYAKVMVAVPQEIQTVIPQVTGIPVVFISALEGRGRIAVIRQVIATYEKWCLRLSTAHLNRWLRKAFVKDQASTQDQILTQEVKGPATHFCCLYIRFLTKSLKEDFDLGGIPIRIMQRSVPPRATGSTSKSRQSSGRLAERIL
ncbi:GTPase Der [Morella rubra]|uniref:GTPase Der n=1 Tax=Morella rubra TaxID=262757 RepID=A0A6A1V721_9ROSI|nr:GTPase Der [Morella rubra]